MKNKYTHTINIWRNSVLSQMHKLFPKHPGNIVIILVLYFLCIFVQAVFLIFVKKKCFLEVVKYLIQCTAIGKFCHALALHVLMFSRLQKWTVKVTAMSFVAFWWRIGFELDLLYFQKKNLYFIYCNICNCRWLTRIKNKLKSQDKRIEIELLT